MRTIAWRVLLVVLLGGVLWVQYAQFGVLREIARAQPEQIRRNEVTTNWLSGGLPHSVTTTRNPGETVKQWRTRHFKAVEDEQDIYPPE